MGLQFMYVYNYMLGIFLHSLQSHLEMYITLFTTCLYSWHECTMLCFFVLFFSFTDSAY